MSGLTDALLMPVKSLFGAPKAPELKPPTPMPTADDAAVRAAKRRQLASMQARGGRLSTILTDGEDKLGG